MKMPIRTRPNQGNSGTKSNDCDGLENPSQKRKVIPIERKSRSSGRIKTSNPEANAGIFFPANGIDKAKETAIMWIIPK